MNILENLNEEQKEAVVSTEGYVRVIAGAGSGKTKTLTHRYAYIVNELGISTANILCVTFTNKAANEMKMRIRNMIGDNDTGYVCTFHGFCVQLLREDIHIINYPRNFVVMDTEDTETILKNVYETCNIKSRVYTFDMAKKNIDKFKLTMKHISYFMELDNSKLKAEYENENEIEKKVILGYIYEQKKNYALDYNDLITVALYILQGHEDIRKKWQQRLMYIMVDEYQDVSSLNVSLVEILSGYHKNLFIVGDPDQTIYSWRGANVGFILDFDKNHLNTKTIKLNRNYRSTPEILDAANSLIENNKNRIPNRTLATRPANILTVYHHSKTTIEEAEWIANNIKTLVAQGIKYSEIALLYRSHFVSRSIEEVFIKEKIPYVLYSGIEFYKRKEIKDILSYMRMVIYSDDLSFQRIINVPKRNIGKKRISFLNEYAEKNNCSLYNALKDNLEIDLFLSTEAKKFVTLIDTFRELHKEMKLSDIFTMILNDSGYEAMLRDVGEEERLNNLAELKNSIFEFEKSAGEENTLEEYLQSIALFTNTDKSYKKDAVKLMTIHIAKGLEFPYVFICGMNEGIFPNSHVRDIDQLEEERRLAYVGYTRAENALFLTESEGYNYDGSFRYPSRFIFNTAKKYMNYDVELEEKLIQNAQMYIEVNEKKLDNSVTKLDVGTKVEHRVFGTGEIIGIKEEIKAYTIKFDNSKTERNLSFDAPLKTINND